MKNKITEYVSGVFNSDTYKFDTVNEFYYAN
jgi:hypothetical protein